VDSDLKVLTRSVAQVVQVDLVLKVLAAQVDSDLKVLNQLLK
jgi:hypothetical protein